MLGDPTRRAIVQRLAYGPATAGQLAERIIERFTAELKERFPEVRVIALPENVGFAAAINAGIRATRGRYVALLNNDTEAEPGWLGEMVWVIETDVHAASVAAKIDCTLVVTSARVPLACRT